MAVTRTMNEWYERLHKYRSFATHPSRLVFAFWLCLAVGTLG